MVTQAKRKKKTTADTIATHQEASLLGLYFSFRKLFCWGRLHRHQCFWKMLWIPSLVRKESLLDGFPSVSFVVDMARCRDAQLLLAYFNRADSYSKLRLIYLDSDDMNSFKSIFLEKSYSYLYLILVVHRYARAATVMCKYLPLCLSVLRMATLWAVPLRVRTIQVLTEARRTAVKKLRKRWDASTERAANREPIFTRQNLYRECKEWGGSSKYWKEE